MSEQNKSDNLSNLIISSVPGGIERQERSGQQVTVRLEILPRTMTNPRDSKEDSRPYLERLGIIIEGEYDELFYNVKFPEGWEKAAETHPLWSRLNDEQGRERAVIFYKAAFYDRRAHIRISPRYDLSVRPVGGWGNEYDPDDRVAKECVVNDGGKVIWTSDPMTPYEGQPGYEVSNLLEKIGEAWITSRYPNYRDPFAYWGDLPAQSSTNDGQE